MWMNVALDTFIKRWTNVREWTLHWIRSLNVDKMYVNERCTGYVDSTLIEMYVNQRSFRYVYSTLIKMYANERCIGYVYSTLIKIYANKRCTGYVDSMLKGMLWMNVALDTFIKRCKNVCELKCWIGYVH